MLLMLNANTNHKYRHKHAKMKQHINITAKTTITIRRKKKKRRNTGPQIIISLLHNIWSLKTYFMLVSALFFALFKISWCFCHKLSGSTTKKHMNKTQKWISEWIEMNTVIQLPMCIAYKTKQK